MSQRNQVAPNLRPGQACRDRRPAETRSCGVDTLDTGEKSSAALDDTLVKAECGLGLWGQCDSPKRHRN